ncbi:MAG: EI24 domain-containing protein [Betaproteobacteria bacterium]|nr:MAG: EI24 domain-containing protein [Betaproteobacteria bacterium]
MTGIGGSLLFALANLFHPRMLWLMLWPVMAAMFFWGALALVFWGQLVLWLAELIRQWAQYATLIVPWSAGDVALFAAKVLILIMLVPLIQLTALLLLGVFGMPEMVNHVAQRRFPQLERRHGGGFAGSVWNGVVALCGLALLALASLPLWLFPPLWPILPVAIMGWVNQKVLRYDALAEHADAAEMQKIFAERRGSLYVMGVVLALVAFVPLLGFFAPVVVGLTFIHYLLAQLKLLRERPAEASADR